jgi:hypothetical protein
LERGAACGAAPPRTEDQEVDKVIELLFSSWIGLLSLFTIVFMVGMAIYLYVFFSRLAKGGGSGAK